MSYDWGAHVARLVNERPDWPLCTNCGHNRAEWFISMKTRQVVYKDLCDYCKHEAFRQITEELEAKRTAEFHAKYEVDPFGYVTRR